MTKLGTHNKQDKLNEIATLNVRKFRSQMEVAKAINALEQIKLDDETRAQIEALVELPNIDENARFILERILYAAE